MGSSDFAYSDYSVPDPPHQPLYLHKLLHLLKHAGNVRRVLDAGCGDGNFTQSLQEAGYEMYGIDLSEGGIQKAKSRFPACSFALHSIYDDYRAAFPGVNAFD